MCGRFTLALAPEDIASLLRINRELDEELGLAPRWNIAPGQEVVAAARPEPEAEITPARFRWGLVPSWAEDPTIGNRMINARSETAAEKPSFRSAWRHRRCLIPADGFYEWQRTQAGKQAWYFRRPDASGFFFAGLWERWEEKREAGPLLTCTVLTTVANGRMAPIHQRMPVILPPEFCDDWMDPGMSDGRLRNMLAPLPADALIAHPVSDRVNSPRHDDATCVEPVDLPDHDPGTDTPSQGTLF